MQRCGQRLREGCAVVLGLWLLQGMLQALWGPMPSHAMPPSAAARGPRSGVSPWGSWVTPGPYTTLPPGASPDRLAVREQCSRCRLDRLSHRAATWCRPGCVITCLGQRSWCAAGCHSRGLPPAWGIHTPASARRTPEVPLTWLHRLRCRHWRMWEGGTVGLCLAAPSWQAPAVLSSVLAERADRGSRLHCWMA